MLNCKLLRITLDFTDRPHHSTMPAYGAASTCQTQGRRIYRRSDTAFIMSSTGWQGGAALLEAAHLKAVLVVDHGRLHCQQCSQDDILDAIEQLVCCLSA
jgi:hypothetical protein